MKIFLKFFPALIFWAVFVYVILQIPYPESITQANLFQLVSFFLPLFIALSFTLKLLLQNILVSLSISMGIIFLLILKSLDSLNLVTGILTVMAIGLLISYFKKIKKKGLTLGSKIPKLTNMRKQKL